MEYTLTIVEGVQPGSNGIDLGDPDSPVQYDQLPDDVTNWLDGHNFDTDHPDIWVLVTPADEDTNTDSVIARRVIEI